MSITSFRNRCAQSRRASRPHTFLPSVEGLENRAVPATLSLSNGVLVYMASAGVANQLTLAYNANNTFTFQDASEPIAVIGLNDLDPNPNSATVAPPPLLGIRLELGDRDDTPQILSTKAATPVLVYAGTGDDRIYVGNSTTTLSGILGAVNVRGQDGHDELYVNDYATPLPGQTYQVTAQGVTRGGIAGVNYDTGVEYVRLNAGTGNDIVHVWSTSSATVMAVSLKTADDDTVFVGSQAGSLDTIQGYLLIAGDGAPSAGRRDSLIVNDQNDPDANVYDLTANTAPNGGTYTQVSRNGTLLLNAASLKSLVLNAGAGSDTINIKGVLVPETVNAGAGSDTIKMYPNLVFAPVTVNGQGGTNLLDYLLYSSDVYVNLLMGVATDLASLSGIHNVFGGQGNDVLVGNADANVLRGAGGRDVIIGGRGRDLVDGGADEDLLIAGFTTFDANQLALDGIRAEWASNNNYAMRISHLKNGNGLNAPFQLSDGLTVFDDGAFDQVIGAGGQDWFWANLAEILDLMPGEQVK